MYTTPHFIFSTHTLLSLNFTGDLLKDAANRITFALQPGTLKNYAYSLELFQVFCVNFNCKSTQFSLPNILAYIEWLAQKDFTAGTVANHVSAVKYLAKIKGADISVFSDFLTVQLLKSVQNTLPFRKKRRFLLTPSEFLKMLEELKNNKHYRHGLRLAMILGYLGLLRVSSYTVPAECTFDSTNHTTLSDCSPENGHLSVQLKSTKTCHNKDPVLVTVPASSNPLLSPTYNFDKMQSHLVNINPLETPIIAFKQGKGLSSFLFNTILASLAKKCKISKHITSHTLRRSGATFLSHAGASGTQLAQHGTWKSECYLNYMLNDSQIESCVQQATDAIFN